MKELSIDVLTDEAMKLLRMDVEDLYATLGGQLLAKELPSRVAGIVSYLSAVRSASEAKSFYEALLPDPNLTDWGGGLGVIYEQMKRDGMGFLQEVRGELRKVLCNEDILRLSDQVNRSTMQIIVIVVRATLGLPRDFDAIAVTVAAILLKMGLRDFCSKTEAT
jgi:hypothetical protein